MAGSLNIIFMVEVVPVLEEVPEVVEAPEVEAVDPVESDSGSVEIDENESGVEAGSAGDGSENAEAPSDGSFVESSDSSTDVPEIPVEVVPAPAPLPDDLPSASGDYSIGDVLDAFTSGLLSGVSDDLPADGDSSVVVPSGPVAAPEEPIECVGVEAYALPPVESSTGLKGVLLDILGPYDTVVTQFKYQQGNNSYYTYVNDISPDYPWIASALLFIVLLVSLFRFLRRCFCG